LNISNELKVALTILVALVAAFLGYRVMNDLPLFRQSTVVYSYFERTDGLTPGNYVYVNGVKVGSVKRLELGKGDSVRVTMTFDLGVEIPENSVAYLESSGLLDEKAIIVERGDSPQNIEYGGYLDGVYRGGMMETLKQEGEALSEDISESFEQLNKLLAQLNNMLTDETKGQVDTVLKNIESTTEEVATIFRKKRSDLEMSIEHAQKFLANVDTVSMRNKERVDSVLTGLDRSLTELEMLTRDLNQTNAELNQILTKINNGEGSFGKFVNDPSLYNNLDSLSAEMKLLIKNINEKPGEYLKHMRLIEVF
jgi:ABC-type transporter Mla subunit MlaD